MLSTAYINTPGALEVTNTAYVDIVCYPEESPIAHVDIPGAVGVTIAAHVDIICCAGEFPMGRFNKWVKLSFS